MLYLLLLTWGEWSSTCDTASRPSSLRDSRTERERERENRGSHRDISNPRVLQRVGNRKAVCSMGMALAVWLPTLPGCLPLYLQEQN